MRKNIPWKLIEIYFKDQHLKRLVRHQIESYNHFIEHQINDTINMFNPVILSGDFNEKQKKDNLEIKIIFDNFHMYRPQIHENNGATKLMFPQEARLRNFTYNSSMLLDINIEIKKNFGKNNKQCELFYKKLKKIHIGKIPVMLKSNICILSQYKHYDTNITGECYFDAGGYFIINGSEKTVLAQERAAENRVYCFNIKKGNTKWSWKAEIKSIPDDKCISPKQIYLMIASRNNEYGFNIYVQIPRIKQPIPLCILFRALGIISDKDICKKIILNIEDNKMKKMLYALKASLVKANNYLTREDAMKYIVNHAMFTPINMDKEEGLKKKREFTENVLNKDLFPHCKTMLQKIYFLGYMTNRLLQCSFGWISQDNRDSYINKRIDLTGTLLNNLFRNYFNKLVKDMQKQIHREIKNGSWRSTESYDNIINYTNIYKIVKSSTIENGLKRALATGDFGIKNINSNKMGVAQVLNRLTYISSLSHLRRVNTPIDKSGKLIPPRKQHNTQWGYICPAESPEGQSVGVVKNLSYMCHISLPSGSETIYNILEKHVVTFENTTPKKIYNKVKIFINGNWIGYVINPKKIYNMLKNAKYQGIINIYVSIIFNYTLKEIRINTSAGRPTRPLFRIENNKLLLTNTIENQILKNKVSWNDLLVNHKYKKSIIEYIDPMEQNSAMIAMNTDHLKDSNNYTHMEIHPSTIFGILASCIPFPEHNQSPRNTYQCAMGKQAMGIYVTNFNQRMDKTSYVLTYPMRPLVDTRLMNILKLNNIPSGENVIVMIGSYSGYNQEDSIIFNKGSLDRGLFSATIYHTEKDEDKKIHGDEEIRCRPDISKTKGMNFANYEKLTNKGIIPENTLIENKDIIMGKVIPIKENRNDHTKIVKYRDQSLIYRTSEETYIDKNLMERNGDGYIFCKVKTRTYRIPVMGDKFSSRHGQKGTIGIILPEEDMPYDENGIRPDIIINPHAIPSRMTIGQLKETLLGILLLELGLFGDGTSFNKLSINVICDELLRNGYEKYGNKLLINGMTGQQIETSIFMGPAFYQRLKHMVNDKHHSRSIGPKVVLTRQPAEGRARDGGLRFGEMERDCMMAHGTTRFMKGRLYDASDKYEVYVCKNCGLIIAFNNNKHIHYCKNCDSRINFARVKIPYACKLLFHELITMNIAPRIITE